VQIHGKLESETSKDPDNLRELDVETVKVIPVVVPRPAQTASAAPAPAPAAAPAPRAYQASPAPAAPEAPVHHTLPKTASQIPAIGLAGFFLLAAGLGLRTMRLRQQG